MTKLLPQVWGCCCSASPLWGAPGLPPLGGGGRGGGLGILGGSGAGDSLGILGGVQGSGVHWHQHRVTPVWRCPPSRAGSIPQNRVRVLGATPAVGAGVQRRWGPPCRPRLNKLVVCGGCSFSGGDKEIVSWATGGSWQRAPAHPSGWLSVRPAGHPRVPRGGWGGGPGDGDSPVVVVPRQASAWRG